MCMEKERKKKEREAIKSHNRLNLGNHPNQNRPTPTPLPLPSWEKISLNGDFFAGYNGESKRLGNHLQLRDPTPPVGMVSQV